MKVDYRYCESSEDLEIARNLFREYSDWLQVDLCFQDFEAELAGLPGKYAPPKGMILIAFVDSTPVGCVAVRPLEEDAELKRLYVRPEFRGHKIGEGLLIQSIEFVRSAGYPALILDTLSRLESAGYLYKKHGFVPFENYNQTDLDQIEFYRLDLRAT